MWIWRGLLGLLALAVVGLAAGAVWQWRCEIGDARAYPPPGRMVEVGGGRRLHLRCEGAGPSVVMLAGGGTPSVVSYGLQDRLAAFSRACSYDRPGLGWSDRAAAPMTLTDHIADLDRLLAQVPGPVILVPESFGALIAIGYAQRHPDRVAGIVFVDGAEPATWRDTMAGVNPLEGAAREVLMQAATRTGIVRLVLPRLLPPWVAELPPRTQGQIRALYSRPAPGLGEAMTAFRRTPPAEWPRSDPGALGALPVVVLSHGQASSEVTPAFEKMWPVGQARLVALTVPPARQVVAAGAGHAIAEEQPDLVARAVRGLISPPSAPPP